MKRIRFITGIPANVLRGSGNYVGTQTLAKSLRKLGAQVDFVTPQFHLPFYTAERYLFNQTLRFRTLEPCDTIVGFDLDGYAVAGRSPVPHFAHIKGVLADAVPFERGFTRATLGLQARWEALHAQRADRVVTISQYCASRIRELYGVRKPISVVPESIDLALWRELFRQNPARRREGKFTVLSVCRFYPRKRVDVLLEAASRLRESIPDLEVRIVGGGPDAAKLRELWRAKGLEACVKWVGDASRSELAREYNRADVFCHPSEQEGFGIVFLEAMAAGRPIIAADCSAVPEVVRHGIRVEPGNAGALAEGIERLHRNPELRESLGHLGAQHVEQFDSPRVARLFLAELEGS
ncbi:MAG: glycosyltransferase family 4 protein [Acidobacteriota bacterium]|nr:glycosyltransferase family 4 protein [Acidobacteriota bacterium]